MYSYKKEDCFFLYTTTHKIIEDRCKLIKERQFRKCYIFCEIFLAHVHYHKIYDNFRVNKIIITFLYCIRKERLRERKIKYWR